MAAGEEVPPESKSEEGASEAHLQEEGIENVEEAQSGISHLNVVDVLKERKVNALAGVPTLVVVHSTEPPVVPVLQTHLQVDEQANDSNNNNSGSLSGTSVSAHHDDSPWDAMHSTQDERMRTAAVELEHERAHVRALEMRMHASEQERAAADQHICSTMAKVVEQNQLLSSQLAAFQMQNQQLGLFVHLGGRVECVYTSLASKKVEI